MKRLLWTLPLVAALCGCAGFGDYLAEDPDGDGPEPARWVSASGEVMSGGLTGFEQGGIIAGLIGAAFTFAKTGMRLYSAHKAAKAAEEALTK